MSIVSYGGGVAGRAGPSNPLPSQISGTASMVLASTPTISSSLIPSWIANLPTTISFDAAALALASVDFAFSSYLNTPNVTISPLDAASTEANPIARTLPSWLTLPAVQPPVLRAAQGTTGGTSVSGYKFGININTSPPAQGYTVAGGRVIDSLGSVLQIRGVALYGFGNTKVGGPGGYLNWPISLWEMGWKEQIQHIKALGFNSIRLTINPMALYDRSLAVGDAGTSSVLQPINSDLLGMYGPDILDLWVNYADAQGINILFDFRPLRNNAAMHVWYCDTANVNTWDGNPYPQSFWIRDLTYIADRYKNVPHAMGIDVFNEPNGIARWDSGDNNMTNPANYWRPNVEQAAAAILAANPRMLVIVQGCGPNFDGQEQAVVPGVYAYPNWGESLQAEVYKPLNIPTNKLVLAPHTYGPDVSIKSTFTAANFPDNLGPDWQLNFGSSFPTHAVIPGEWGGRYGTGTLSNGQPYPPGITGDTDRVWQNAFKDWMKSKGMNSSWYWSYTDGGTPEGGVLDISRNVRQDKYALLQDHWGYTTYTTTIFRTEATMREQGMWLDGLADGLSWGGIQTTPGKAFAKVAQAVDSISVMRTALSNDQFAEGTVSRAAGYSPGVVHQLELLLRFNLSANTATGVCVRWAHNGTGSVVKFNGAVGNTSPVTISATSWGAPADGDVLRAEAIGTVLTIKKNGAVVATGTI